MIKMNGPILFSIAIMVFGMSNVSGASNSLVVTSNISDNILLPGDESFLIINIENIASSDVPTIYITLQEVDPPLIIKGLGEPRYIDVLKANSEIEIVYRITIPEDTPAGKYLARFKVNEFRPEHEKEVIIHNAIIEVTGSSNLVISSVKPSSISPGQKAELSYTIENMGNAELKNIEVDWNSTSNVLLPLEKDSKTIIAKLSPGETREISIPVVAKSSVDPDIYSLTFTSRYYLNGKKETSKSAVGLVVGGTTDFGVTAQESSTGSIAVTVANIGLTPAYSVSVKIGPSEAFIGNIDAGDYSIANIIVPSSATNGSTAGMPGNQNNGSFAGQPTQEMREAIQQREGGSSIPGGFAGRSRMSQDSMNVQIQYTDTLGERHTVTKEVSVTQSAQSTRQMSTGTSPNGSGSGNNNILYAGLGIVALVAGVALYKRRRAVSK